MRQLERLKVRAPQIEQGQSILRPLKTRELKMQGRNTHPAPKKMQEQSQTQTAPQYPGCCRRQIRPRRPSSPQQLKQRRKAH